MITPRVWAQSRKHSEAPPSPASWRDAAWPARKACFLTPEDQVWASLPNLPLPPPPWRYSSLYASQSPRLAPLWGPGQNLPATSESVLAQPGSCVWAPWHITNGRERAGFSAPKTCLLPPTPSRWLGGIPRRGGLSRSFNPKGNNCLDFSSVFPSGQCQAAWRLRLGRHRLLLSKVYCNELFKILCIISLKLT